MTWFVLAIIATCTYAATLSKLSVSMTPTTVQQSATYTIQFNTVSATTSSATVRIVFPSQFTITDSTNYSCSATSFMGSTSTVYCSASSNTITVFNLFANGSVSAGYIFPFSVILRNIINPQSSAVTSPIQLSTINSSGAVIDSALSSSSLTVSATKASMTSASMSPNSDILGEVAT